MRRLIGISEVCELTGRSRSTVWRYLQSSALAFPRPVRVGPRDRGWFADEVVDWIEALPRRGGAENESSSAASDRASE